VTVGGDLVDVLVAAVEQASPEQRARLRAALEVDAPTLAPPKAAPRAYTTATLAEEVGRSSRSIRGAIARGELDAVRRGRGWVISADAVDRWVAGGGASRGRHSRPRGPRRRTPGWGPMRRALA
jgi:excisionase family DNA binding protein